jgi:hypothetical protein
MDGTGLQRPGSLGSPRHFHERVWWGRAALEGRVLEGFLAAETGHGVERQPRQRLVTARIGQDGCGSIG